MKIFLLLILTFGCSKQEKVIDNLEMFKKVRIHEKDVEVLVPPSIDKPLVYCHQYQPPCKRGYKVMIKSMEVIALYYEDTESAKKAAKYIQGYRLNNWAFDKVKGEPILERLFENKLKAKFFK